MVHAGRKQDALESLRMISRFNDSELALDLDDVEDHIRVPRSHLSDSAFLTENSIIVTVIQRRFRDFKPSK